MFFRHIFYWDLGHFAIKKKWVSPRLDERSPEHFSVTNTDPFCTLQKVDDMNKENPADAHWVKEAPLA